MISALRGKMTIAPAISHRPREQESEEGKRERTRQQPQGGLVQPPPGPDGKAPGDSGQGGTKEKKGCLHLISGGLCAGTDDLSP